MDRYVGLDGHSQTSTFAVMGRTSGRLTSKVVETSKRYFVAGFGGLTWIARAGWRRSPSGSHPTARASSSQAGCSCSA